MVRGSDPTGGPSPVAREVRPGLLLGWAALLGGSLLLSGWLLKATALGAPFLPIGLLWTVVLGVASWRARRESALRRGALCLATCALALALAEGALVVAGRAIPRHESDAGPLLVPDPVLGWTLTKSGQVRVRKIRTFDLVYETTYTTDEHGQRVCPQPPDDAPGGVVSFFGGSFTMGSGVADGQALPCQFRAATQDRYRVLNWGVSRFGPHHMLRALDAGLVQARVAPATPHIAVYQALVEHCHRIRAPGWMGYFEPAYVAAPGGGVTLTAATQPAPSTAGWLFHGLWSRSLLFHGLWPRSYECSDPDLQLMVEIIVAARQRLLDAYPRSELLVL
ncbi:MAG: hypothetical protein JRI68_03075, partial [Deltaproteobacteria bacterium]|nr:hypothetical protein [Deltaproteobacteria bacterium]